MRVFVHIFHSEFAGALGTAAFGSFVYYENHVQETPFTNRRRFLAFTEDQIKEMARLELEGVEAPYKL